MNNLLYKDLKLSIPLFFYFMPFLTGALFLIPQWPFFLALMYFFFISVPNIFSSYNSQNDMGFSIMMPVSKKEIVKGKILSLMVLELLHIVSGALFAFIHVKVFGMNNFLMDLNTAFFGLSFVMFGIFNLVFFPLYFKSAYSFGLPTILANMAAIIFMVLVEYMVLFHISIVPVLEGTTMEAQAGRVFILLFGIIIYIVMNGLAYLASVKRFDKVDL